MIESQRERGTQGQRQNTRNMHCESDRQSDNEINSLREIFGSTLWNKEYNQNKNGNYNVYVDSAKGYTNDDVNIHHHGYGWDGNR